MKIKHIPTLLIAGILIGLLLLGAKYFFASVSIVDNAQVFPGAKGRVSFFPKSEVDALELTPAKIDMYSTNVFMFNDHKFNQPGASDYASSVERRTPRTDVATFALEEIVRGPTAEEIDQGLRPTFGEENFITLSGKSQCGIKPFTVSLDPDNYFAKVSFCRDVNLLQDVSMRVLVEQIRKTLIQFEKIHKVQILNKDSNCLDGTKATTPEDCVY
jgi:hypothetical protein